MTKRQKAMAMAWLVERLLLDPRGVSVEALKAEVDRSPRSMRGWLQELREDYPGLRGADGSSLVEVTGEGEARRVSLRRAAPLGGADGATLAGVLLAASMLEELGGTGLERVGEELRGAYTSALPGALRASAERPDTVRKLVVSHPDGPDMWGRARVVDGLVKALLGSTLVRATLRWAPGATTLEPLSLVYRRGELLVVAREPEGEPRVFELSDVVDVVVTEHTFTYPSRREYDPAEILSEADTSRG